MTSIAGEKERTMTDAPVTEETIVVGSSYHFKPGADGSPGATVEVVAVIPGSKVDYKVTSPEPLPGNENVVMNMTPREFLENLNPPPEPKEAEAAVSSSRTKSKSHYSED
jgi:hypothetical protein